MLVILLLLAIPFMADAACPTSDGYSHTCFVSLAGNDSSGTGTIGAPYKGLVRAISVATAGDIIMIRGGRYKTQLEWSGSNWAAPGCTRVSPCTVRAYPGEVVVVDGRGWSNTGTVFAPAQGTFTLTPAYANDPLIGHWRFSGIRVEEIPRFPFWSQSQNDDIHYKSLRIHGSTGIRLSSCDGCKLLGVHIESKNVNNASSANDPPFDCTPVLPSVNHAPWRGSDYGPEGKVAISPNMYQLSTVAPNFPLTKAYGCRGLSVMDSVFRKELSTATDTFGIEYGNNVLVERVRFDAPWSYTHENNYGGGTGGTDSFDMKAAGITIKDVQVRGGKATMKLWGKVDRVQGALVIGADDAGEANISLAGNLSVSSSSYPPSVSFVPVRYAGNTTEGDAYIVIGNGPYGNTPTDKQHIEISNVPGCTSINKHVRVKESVESKHYVFVLENTDGSKLSCNGAYDLAQHSRRTLTRTAVFTGNGSTNITLNSSASFSFGGTKNSCIRFSTTGTLPAGIVAGTCYYIKTESANVITITATPQAGAGGSAALTFSNAGTGVHTATIQDDYTSYAGEMWAPSTEEGRASWGVVMTGVTGISSRGTALGGCVNCVASNYSTRKFKYAVTQGIFTSPRLPSIAAPIVSFGGPRAIFSGSTIYLAYHDINTMGVGAQIGFRTIGTLPAPLTPTGMYYVVASNDANRTIQVSALPGGQPMSFSGGSGRHWLVAPGVSTTLIELSSLGSIAAGNTIQLKRAARWDRAAGLPYPFVDGTDYTVASATTVSVNGTSVFLVELSNGGPAIAHASVNTGTWKAYRTNVAANGGTRNFEVGGYTERVGSGNNTYWTGATSTINSYCAKVEGDANFNPLSNCVATVGEVEALESGSKIENPNLDGSTGRATVSTPSTSWGRGYYAAFHEVVSVAPTAAWLRNKFPEPCSSEDCEVEVATDSNFTSVTENFVIASGGRWQDIAAGKLVALAPSTTYHYRLRQGFDVATGVFTTAPSIAGSGTLQVRLTPPPGGAVHTAVVETSVDGTAWVAEAAVACTANCTVALSRPRGLYWVRHRFRDSQEATLSTSQSELSAIL